MTPTASISAASSGWKRLWSNSLSLRVAVILAVTLGLLGPGFLSVWHQVKTEELAAEASLQSDLSTLVDVLSVSMRDPIWQVSPESGKHIAQAMFRDPRLISVNVWGDHDKVFLELYRSVHVMAPTVSEKRTVTMGGQRIGLVEVTLSAGPMRESVARHLRDLLVREAIVLLFSLVLILWVLERRVFDPVAFVTRSASDFAERRLHNPVALPRSDELGLLADALEKMRVSLLNSFTELERKNIELRAYATTLESRVEQRTLDLTETNQRLTASVENFRSAQRSLIESEKLASLGRLVASIAHELNTPLGNALTVVSALEESHRDFSSKLTVGGLRRSELEHFMQHSGDGLEILRRSVARSAELIADFKQVAVDQSSERRRVFDLSMVIQETMTTLKPKLKRTPYVVQTELTDGVMMDSYPGPLEQVLINLTMNAVIHGFAGRPFGLITLRSELLDNDRVRIIVTDDGVGMDDKVRLRAFEPFFTTRPDSGGSGLGMSIVYSIVTSVLGGRIVLKSKPGDGTAIVIDLPLKPPEYVPGDDTAQ